MVQTRARSLPPGVVVGAAAGDVVDPAAQSTSAGPAPVKPAWMVAVGSALLRAVRPPAAMPPVLVVCFLVNAVGTGAFLSGSAAFLLRYLGLSATQAGIGASVTAATGLVAGVPLGMLADRLGGRRAWLAAALVQGVFFAVYPMVPGFGVYLAVAAGVGTGIALTENAEARYLGDTMPQGRRVRASAYLRSVHNAGLAVGTGVAGAALVVDTGAGYVALAWINGASFFLVAVLVLTRLPEAPRVPGSATATPMVAGRRPSALRDGHLLGLSLLNGVFMLNVPLLLVVFPLWILERTDAPRLLIAVALVVNMALSVSLQVRASRNAEDVRGAAATQRLSGYALAAACVVLAFTGDASGRSGVLLLLLGLLALTGGELFASSAAWGLCYAFAPADRRAEYAAVFMIGSKLAAIAGPALLIPLVMGVGWAGWAALSVAFTLAGTVAPAIVRRAATRRTWAPPTPARLPQLPTLPEAAA